MCLVVACHVSSLSMPSVVTNRKPYVLAEAFIADDQQDVVQLITYIMLCVCII